jgi:hypothetical protein
MAGQIPGAIQDGLVTLEDAVALEKQRSAELAGAVSAESAANAATTSARQALADSTNERIAAFDDFEVLLKSQWAPPAV